MAGAEHKNLVIRTPAPFSEAYFHVSCNLEFKSRTPTQRSSNHIFICKGPYEEQREKEEKEEQEEK